MKAWFNGKEYCHEMVAQRQREFAVSIKAQTMMQEHYGNKYFTLKHSVSAAEADEWRAKAEAIVPPVIMAGVAEQSGAGAPETSVRCGAPADQDGPST